MFGRRQSEYRLSPDLQTFTPLNLGHVVEFVFGQMFSSLHVPTLTFSLLTLALLNLIFKHLSKVYENLKNELLCLVLVCDFLLLLGFWPVGINV